MLQPPAEGIYEVGDEIQHSLLQTALSKDTLNRTLQKRLLALVSDVDELSTHIAQLRKLLSKYPISKDPLKAVEANPQALSSYMSNFEIEKLKEIDELMQVLLPASMIILNKMNAMKIVSVEDPALQFEDELLTRIYKLQALIPHFITRHLRSFKISLDHILKYYKNFLAQWKTMNSGQKKALLRPTPQITGENLDFHRIDYDKALKLLCRDTYGKTQKTNSDGNHPVAMMGGIHFKPDPEGMDHISPTMEYLTNCFFSLFGDDLIAPTTIVKVDNVWVNKIDLSNKNSVDVQRIDREIQSGKSIERILQEQPDLQPAVTALLKPPEKISHVIQAGQTIEGISLQLLLTLLVTVDKLHKEWGIQELIKAIPSLVSGSYAELLLKQYSHKSKQDIFFELIRYLLEQEDTNPLINVESLKNLDEEKMQFKFQKMTEKLSKDDLIICLALLQTWPQLIKNHSFDEVLNFPKLFRQISKIVPMSLPADVVVKELLEFMQRLDSYNFSALCIGGFLLMSSDGKADNFMAVFEKSPTGQVIRWKIVGIDNDRQLAPPISCRAENYFSHVKYILFCFPQMNQAIDKKFRDHFLKSSAEDKILHWLKKLFEQSLRYKRLYDLGILTTAEISDLVLFPIMFDPAIIPIIHKKLTTLEMIFHDNPNATHQQVFEIIEPILAMVYRTLANNLLDSIYIIDKNSIEDILKDQPPLPFAEQGKTLGEHLNTNYPKETEHYENKRTQTLEDVIQLYVGQMDLRGCLKNDEAAWTKLSIVAQSFTLLKKLPFTLSELNQLLHEAVRRNNHYVAALVLRSGANPNYADEAGRTSLHLALNSIADVTELVKVLLAHPETDPNLYDDKGLTPIFYVDPIKQEQVLTALLQGGADIEARDLQTQETLLDKKIRRENPEAFVAFVQKGAGRKVNAVKAMEFVHKYLAIEKYRSQFSEALKLLYQQNMQIAWLASIKVMTQETPSAPHLLIEGLRTGKKYLQIDAATQVFDHSGEIKGQNKYGRRKVPLVDCDGHKMHYKFIPELPLIEEGGLSFEHLTFDYSFSCVAETELFRFFDPKNKNQPSTVLLSLHVEGYNLQDVFIDPNKLKLLELLDPGSFFRLLVFSILTKPEDGKPDNFTLTPFINERGDFVWRLVCHDNDHAFLPSVVMEKGHRKLQTKSIVFCLDQMKDPLSHKDIENFCKLSIKDIKDIFEKWLNHLIKIQEKSDEFFNEKDRERLFKADNPSITRAPFKPGIVPEMYENFILMQNILKDVLKNQSSITGLELLRKVLPLVGIPHEEAFKKIDTPILRFDYLNSAQYSSIAAERYDTLTGPGQILASADIPQAAALANNAGYGPKEALKEFRLALAQQNSLAEVRQALLAKNLKPFQDLLFASSREEVMAQINLASLTGETKKFVFSTLEKIPSSKLNLKDCKDLTTSSLIKILEHSPNLTELDISGCDQLDVDKIFEAFSKNCRVLEKLTANKLPKLYSVGKEGTPFELFSLRRLWLSDCKNLKTIFLLAPELKLLEIKNNTTLIRTEFGGRNLDALTIEGCDSLHKAYIDRIIAQSPQLLRNRRIKLSYILKPHELTLFCQPYGNMVMTAENINYITSGELLDLHGIAVDDKMLARILGNGRVKQINFTGCTHVSWKTIVKILRDCPLIESVQLTDYTSPNFDSTQPLGNVGVNVDALAVDSNNQLYVVARDKDKTIKQLDITQKDINLTFAGHEKWVTCIAMLPYAIATGSHDRTIRIWDKISRQCIRVITAHSAVVGALKFATNYNLLISGSSDKKIKLWDIESGKNIKTFEVRSAIHAIEIISDDCFASGEDNGTIRIWSLVTHECIMTIPAHLTSINALRKVGVDKLASASSDHTIKVFNINTGTCLITLEGHEGPVHSLDTLEAERLLISAAQDNDKIMKVWDLQSGLCLLNLSGHAKRITALKISANCELVSASEDGSIKVTSFKTKTLDFTALRGLVEFAIVETGENVIELQFKQPIAKLQALKCAELVSQLFGNDVIRPNFNHEKNSLEIIINVTNKDLNKPLIKETLIEVLRAVNHNVKNRVLVNLKPAFAITSTGPSFSADANPLPVSRTVPSFLGKRPPKPVVKSSPIMMGSARLNPVENESTRIKKVNNAN